MIVGGLYKKSKQKIVKYGYVRGCPKRPVTRNGSLEILGVKVGALNTKQWSQYQTNVDEEHILAPKGLW
jgi:hypothetical protein